MHLFLFQVESQIDADSPNIKCCHCDMVAPLGRGSEQTCWRFMGGYSYGYMYGKYTYSPIEGTYNLTYHYP